MLKEVAVERYRFTCAGCAHVWPTDYDVQHVEDGHGLTWKYHSLNGIPVPSPAARGSLSCPRCGATWIHVELVAVRTVPLAEASGGRTDPARPVSRSTPAGGSPGNGRRCSAAISRRPTGRSTAARAEPGRSPGTSDAGGRPARPR